MSTSKTRDPEPFQTLLRELLEQAGESASSASSAIGLSEATIPSYLRGKHPSSDSCLVLADHFRLSPNTLLQLAGHDPMRSFQHLDEFNPDVRALVSKVQGIEDASVRRNAVTLVHAVLDLYVRLNNLETTCPPE